MNWDRAMWVLGGVLAAGVLVALPLLVEAARLPFLVAFCLLVPGAGWACRVGPGDLGDRIALAVAISLGATILVATAMVAMGAWSVPAGMIALAVFAALGFAPVGRSASVRRRGGTRTYR